MTINRVATFNIRHGLGADGVIDLDRVAHTMAATGADLIALQEVDRGLDRTGMVDQPEVLSELTGFPIHFRSVLKRGGGRYGLALAGEGLSEVTYAELPRAGDEQARGVVGASWRGLAVLVSHLTTQAEIRPQQTSALADMARRAAGPVMVLGDLNQDRRHLSALLDAGLNPGPGRHTTFLHLGRRRQIDYVLAGNGIEVVRSWTVPTDASDHLPLVAEIQPVAPPRR
ncbi:MAG: endonuclease/exonuclease/phosphatase family protein [Actinobacteria bacterium]|nr:endonuclease/exonuclease/phosphatase family protein [Actinomycetota bacterium]